MLILPAIDLLDGKVVRLVEGRRDRATIYSDEPGEVARRFVAAGARRLHVVDLDGAFAGRRENRTAVKAILAAGAEVQVGGGVRELATCERLLDEGAHAVVLGTAAVKNPELVSELCARLPGRVIVAVDARDGKVAVEGWAEATALDAFELARASAGRGAAAILYTDIARDGTGVGPNVEASARLSRALAPLPLIASGGIGTLDHLRALAQAGVPQAVVGRALYEGAFTVEEALAAAVAAEVRP
ncbi:MAG TPA: 1-(5-phosphoribosyl)-5-[(5-phosphoribosylamino)methylideneamino]imidazole-4-carboxamide isomerase [Polyangia bacterium]